ncbi:OLC1v1004255C1 [Oldenlandia corymbosa var. corymbosa]|uniref:Potassium transporter n=1 Tax=Oldenlandia corymbosa var. corymbosa TaxID=529605 RepID=A0AAV1DBV8_OLDCO|nr:OLC1v1004255C1 [Oldenlandia corymbosa var. corymbosa]
MYAPNRMEVAKVANSGDEDDLVVEEVKNNYEEDDDDQNENPSSPPPQSQLKGKNLSWYKLRRYDSLDIESRKFGSTHHSKNGEQWSVILHLAFQSIGVVYGDIGTSPLYVYASTFTGGIKHNDDILGVLSLIFYTITLIPLLKYVFIVLRANDNGDGGTFAMYSLICRYAKVGLTPSEEASDQDVSTFQLEMPNHKLRIASKLKSKLENSRFAKFFLLFATMLGTSMVIGDGVLTPCISVLSAVGGIKEATDSMTEGRIVMISVAILVLLFTFQRLGTDKVGYTFAPIILVWFAFNAGIGVFNFIKYDPSVVKAINPAYIVDYFKRNKKDAWISLGGVVLAITGTEALFADVGHFSVRSIQISMCTITYPALILAYTGQASYLRKHNLDVPDTFFKSIPGPMYWPMFVVAVLASIIASQAMISGTFAIIQQSLSLGCFPRVKIIHTSKKYAGQVYIPEINYLLMVACVAVTIGFKTTQKIGNAYGIAVVFVMSLTSAFLVLIMIMIWKTNIFLVISYILIIGSVELLYLSSVLYKFDQGGYLPLAFAMVLMLIMFVWNNVYRKKYYFELDNKVSPEMLQGIVADTKTSRVPGLAVFYSELVHGIPPIFKHYVANVPALHSVLIFVSIKSLPISKVPIEERFLFRRVRPNDLNVYRCVVRYGYTDAHNEEEPFERMLVERLKDFVREDFMSPVSAEESNDGNNEHEEDIANRAEFEKQRQEVAMARDIELVDKAWRGGVVHLVGEHEVIAGKGANIGKKIMIDYAYNFLKRNLRQSNKIFDIPHKRMLKVGMTYEL